MAPDDWFRRAFVRAVEKVPVADRAWNDRVADALLADDRFREDLILWMTYSDMETIEALEKKKAADDRWESGAYE